MQYIGESINGTIPQVNKAILDHDEAFIVALAKQQVENGADYLDVNAGTGGLGNEKEDLLWLIELLKEREKIACPLCLDSSEPEILIEAQKSYQEKPLYNSVCGGKKLEKMLPVIAERPCGVIGLAHGESGIPDHPEERFDFAEIIIKELRAAAVEDDQIYIDPIIMSLSTNTAAGLVTLETIRLVHQAFPKVNIVLPISNIGFGIPKRRIINNAFAAMCVQNGANVFIADVRDHSFIAATLAAEALMDKDRFCKKYIKAYKKGKLE
ncbi:MAG: dihydropteroate synthase [Eubacterium sp.]